MSENERDGDGKPLRFVDAMPRPLFVVFAVFVVGAVVAVVTALFWWPGGAVPLGERRPPGTAVQSHDVGRIIPAPLPSAVGSAPSPCAALDDVRIVAGGDGITRVFRVLQRLCPLAGAGVSPDVQKAVRALDGATIRFGGFGVTGVESTVDVRSRTIWLNVAFALRGRPADEIGPLLAHEAFHLAHGSDPPTALQELGARRVELAACRHLVRIDEWPRACRDARALAEMPEARALEVLAAAGYAR